MSSKKNLAVIFGGKSAEHDISIKSAQNIIQHIDEEKCNIILVAIDKKGSWFIQENQPEIINELSINNFNNEILLCLDGSGRFYDIQNQKYITVDIAHPILHGPFGEDGAIQGLLKTARIPYIGPDVLGSAIGMDKEIMKRILRDAGIRIGPFITVYKGDKNPSFESVEEELCMPVFIKPANMGSSIGISKIYNKEQYIIGLEEAFKYDKKVIIEANIVGREIECAVLGNENPKASILGEVIIHDEFYAFETKYIDEDGASIIIPAKINPQILEKTQKIAIETFKVLACEGLSRVDVFIQEDGEIIVNEINTLPGFTSVSMYPMLWKESGLQYADLLLELQNLAIKRFERDELLV